MYIFLYVPWKEGDREDGVRAGGGEGRGGVVLRCRLFSFGLRIFLLSGEREGVRERERDRKKRDTASKNTTPDNSFLWLPMASYGPT